MTPYLGIKTILLDVFDEEKVVETAISYSNTSPR
jgi:hypothetical protein